MTSSERPTAENDGVGQCARDDHDRVWQAGREAGYRDALIALSEHHDGKFYDELDRAIADSLRRDREYVEAHDLAHLRDLARRCHNGAPYPYQEFYDLGLSPLLDRLADALERS